MRTGHRITAAMAVVAGVVAALPAALAEEAPIGQDEYMKACASCHGASGEGDGPVAAQLVTPPADLTTLARDDGGDFPVKDVFEIIDGRADVAAHGSREMPVWGARYLAEADGMLGPYGDETAVTARILLLTYYLQSIQKP